MPEERGFRMFPFEKEGEKALASALKSQGNVMMRVAKGKQASPCRLMAVPAKKEKAPSLTLHPWVVLKGKVGKGKSDLPEKGLEIPMDTIVGLDLGQKGKCFEAALKAEPQLALFSDLSFIIVLADGGEHGFIATLPGQYRVWLNAFRMLTAGQAAKADEMRAKQRRKAAEAIRKVRLSGCLCLCSGGS